MRIFRSFFEFFTTVWKPGLGRELFLRFLIISLLPMSIIGWLAVNNAKQTILENRLEQLTTVAEAKSSHIQTYIRNIITTLHLNAELVNTINFIESLKSEYKSSNKPLEKFVGSFTWANLEDKYGADIIHLVENSNYIDIQLLDTQGNILYSIRLDDDLGTNILTGKYSNTKYAAAAKEALKTGRPVYSDLEFYPPYNNQLSSFLLQAIVDEYGTKIGLLSVHVSQLEINKILSGHAGLGTSAETYLVGQDLLLRTPSRFEKESSILRLRVNTKGTQYLDTYLAQKENEKTKIGIKTFSHAYSSYQNTLVLGVSIPVNFAGTPMIMMAEISEDEAFASALKLTSLVSGFVITTTLLVIILSIYSSRNITGPIIQLTSWARELAVGTLQGKYIKSPNNEIGILNAAFGELVNSLQQIAWTLEEFSVGDFSKSVTPRGEQDIVSISLNQMRDSLLMVVTQANQISNGDYSLDMTVRGERDQLGGALSDMTHTLRKATIENKRLDWIKSGQTRLNNIMSGEQTLNELSGNVITFLSTYVSADIGCFYSLADPNELRMTGSYVYVIQNETAHTYKLGMGLVGQCAKSKENIIVDDIPNDYMNIQSGLGQTQPRQIILVPLIYNDNTLGVMELGFRINADADKKMFIDLVTESIAIAINTVLSRVRITDTLLEVRSQSEALQAQQEELKASNEELEEQTQLLRQSEEELKGANEELENKSIYLEKQKEIVEHKNKEVEEKAKELAAASKYKSEFLANMSHELRTPLNSLLILAKLLGDNKSDNLTKQQQEWARVIHNSGTDLLSLINDILDLSKVEAGMLSITVEIVLLDSIAQSMQDKFIPLAKHKGINFMCENEFDKSVEILSDTQRISQILKNLLANAVKFTEIGTVTLSFHKPKKSMSLNSSHLTHDNSIAITVSDTGIGIEERKLENIFLAFQQADGSTSRKYGGTGLGLSISRELCQLLGGEIQVKSGIGKGSEFTLILPYENDTKPSNVSTIIAEPLLSSPEKEEIRIESKPTVQTNINENLEILKPFISDDRLVFNYSKKSVLIIEDDPVFATTLMTLARTQNYQAIVAGNGRSGMALASHYLPNAILLDLCLPDINGEEVLAYVKEDLATRHIPVHIISGKEKEHSKEYIKKGAFSFITKPVNIETIEHLFSSTDELIDEEHRNILLIDNNKDNSSELIELLENNLTTVFTASDIKSAKKKLHSEKIHCILLDLGLPNVEISNFLKAIHTDTHISCPILVHIGENLSDHELAELNKLSNSVIIKGHESYERLLDETMLFLHHVESKLPKQQREIIAALHNSDAIFKDKKILAVDDDMRNLFALSGLLSDHGMMVTMAENGKDAISKLHADIDLILMDIMMPVMDGYEAIECIRKDTAYKDMPIIAVTAKAMPEDKAMCISAGANDYLTKPIDSDKLLSMMRIWLHKNK